MWALREFKNRVHLFQQYCELLLQIPHLRAAAPDLVQHIESVTGQKASGSNVPPLTPSVVAGLQQQPATVAGNSSHRCCYLIVGSHSTHRMNIDDYRCPHQYR